MEFFGRKPAVGPGHIDFGNGRVRYEILKIDRGWRIEGRVGGRPGRIEFLRMSAPPEFLMNNWQSWGPTQKVSRETRFDEYEEILRKRRGLLFSPIPEEMRRTLISDYFIAWGNRVAGFLTSRDGHPYFAVEGDELVACVEYFGTDLGGGTELEPLVVLEDMPLEEALEEYARLSAEANAVTVNPWNPVGWCSWYQYFGKLAWPDIVKNLDIARGIPAFPFQVFQIDDGYERDIGDWDKLCPGYPAFGEMASAVRERGFVPGIWTAPFSVARTSELFGRHPEWMVRRNGRPEVCFRAWDKDIFALDTTNADAKQWLYEIFAGLKKAGFAYFKIDFLFSAAMPGERSRPVSPIRAYREGLEVIRQAVGGDFVLGCGAPLWPSAGLVDGMRIGEDTAPYWKTKPSPFQGPNAYFALKNALMRQFMHGRLWLNDPDCVLLRESDIELSENERELYALVCGALDNILIDSDDLSLVGNSGKELFERALKLRGGRARVLMPGEDDLFIVESRGGQSGNVTLVVNLADEDRTWRGETIPARSCNTIRP
jgi:alpha-galactosidase